MDRVIVSGLLIFAVVFGVCLGSPRAPAEDATAADYAETDAYFKDLGRKNDKVATKLAVEAHRIAGIEAAGRHLLRPKVPRDRGDLFHGDELIRYARQLRAEFNAEHAGFADEILKGSLKNRKVDTTGMDAVSLAMAFHAEFLLKPGGIREDETPDRDWDALRPGHAPVPQPKDLPAEDDGDKYEYDWGDVVPAKAEPRPGFAEPGDEGVWYVTQAGYNVYQPYWDGPRVNETPPTNFAPTRNYRIKEGPGEDD